MNQQNFNLFGEIYIISFVYIGEIKKNKIQGEIYYEKNKKHKSDGYY